MVSDLSNSRIAPAPEMVAGESGQVAVVTSHLALTATNMEVRLAGLPNAAFDRLLAIVKSSDRVSVPLSGGRFALVDSADAELVLRHDWRFTSRYASAQIDGRTTLMHRFIPLQGSAFRAYDKAAQEHHGEFAKTNADLDLY